MKKKASVSVIVPIYKTPIAYLKQCIESILTQDFIDISIILVDDGSPDNCGSICDTYAQKDDRITVIHQKNAGVAAARNSGIKACDSDWITFVDPDDWIEPNYISTFLNLAKNRDADIIICSCYVNYAQKQIPNAFFRNNEIYAKGKEKDRMMLQFLCAQIYKDNLGTADSGSPWCKFYKKSFIDKYNIRFNPFLERMEDNAFNLFAYQKSNAIYYNNTYLYHYRKSLYSGFSKYSPNIEKSYELFFKIFSDFIEKEDKTSLFQDAYNIKILNSIYVYCKMKYFHPDNPFYLKENFRQLKDLLHSKVYFQPLHNIKIKYLSLIEKVFYLAIRLDSPFLLWILYKSKDILFKITGKGI
jgi:glycosyltransferase involved in cell wall biosynthesis